MNATQRKGIVNAHKTAEELLVLVQQHVKPWYGEHGHPETVYAGMEDDVYRVVNRLRVIRGDVERG